MKINEIFYSIQGEGKWSGLPNIFIRTTGCNLRCSFCDTKYAYEKGKELSINEIFSKVKKYNCKFVCITGGEPLIQKDTIRLIEDLIKNNYSITIETNGSIDLSPLIKIDKIMISCDIKCPSSNMHKKMCFENIKILKEKDQLKFVIKDKKDYNYAKKIVQNYQPICTVFFQPVWGTNIKNLAEWILKDNLDVKIGLQIHKIIWGDKKGV